MTDIRIVSLLALVLCLYSCDRIFLGEDDDFVSLSENLHTPLQVDDGWEVSSMAEEGVNIGIIENFVKNLHSDTRNIHSILIIKNNKLVLESYFGGWHRERLQSLRSDTKSVTSALIGIAFDQNFISDVNQKVFDFFPEYEDLRTDEKDKIKLEHLLTMTAGLQWDQTSYPSDDPRNDEDGLSKSKDGFRYTLQKDVVKPPGTNFNYSSGSSDLLAGIIHHTTGMHAAEFAKEYLFNPLGIKHYGWRKNINGFSNAGYGLFLYPRDMAKIGQLFLDSGKWKGQQIISAQWIKKSTEKFIGYPFNANIGYGYQWWTRNWDIRGNIIKTFQAQGNGGQIICVIPDLNAVVVLTGGNYGSSSKSQTPYNFLQGYILPSLL